MKGLTIYARKISEILPSWLYKIGAQTWIDKKFPRHIFIETTSFCNLRCSYCPRPAESKHMEFSLFQKTVDEASKFGHRSFSLHLFGEPLLWSHIIRGIEYLKRFGHTVILTTNGTMLDRMACELLKAGVDQIIWTWRPESKISVQTLRSLSKILKVRILKEITPIPEINRFRQWPNVEIKSLHNYGGNIRRPSNTPAKRWPCYHLWFAPAVSVNGDILICCNDPLRKSVIGNITNMPLAEAWKIIERLRNDHLNGTYEGICKECNCWTTYPNIFYSWQYST